MSITKASVIMQVKQKQMNYGSGISLPYVYVMWHINPLQAVTPAFKVDWLIHGVNRESNNMQENIPP